ncbi:MAG: helix-turn-helix domain-containing protein [bacterium]
MLNQVLQENGFTGKEAKIYLATLELGSAPASSIARHAEENRITTYTVLKELCKKSIATEVIRGKIKYYTVISPKRLLKLQEEKSKKLEKMIPTLLAIADKHGNAPKIYFYE